MSQTTTAATIFGPVRVQRLERTSPELAMVRHQVAAHTYAVEGNQVAGMVAVSPAYDDETQGDIFLGTEKLRALVPTRFSLDFGRSGSTRPLPYGAPVKHSPILTIDGTEVLAPGLTLARGGDTTDFPVTIRTGDWTSRPASALVAASTHQVIRAVLTVHETDTDRVSEADRTYAQYRTLDRRTSTQRDLQAALRLRDQLQARITRLETYLAATESGHPHPRS
ncbi:hypothetical protein JHN59_32140 [Streptomyces sp. MBT49]|uniref:hypothetical protein n=1 Tax=Streptomyces sp. MBT49 TaxID=1488380 RepID=UPI00190E02E5|nr:hypothetical protein [Streptomyces sp. MBT49]MBK3629389.1 hypothetical protein [Streptomyces sp. MBT49]